jgi:hypothetical protein
MVILLDKIKYNKWDKNVPPSTQCAAYIEEKKNKEEHTTNKRVEEKEKI